MTRYTVSDEIVQIIRDNSNSTYEKRIILSNLGYGETDIDELFSVIGHREFVRSYPHVLPNTGTSDIELSGDYFLSYLDYLEQNTRPDQWIQRKQDMESSLRKLLPHLSRGRMVHGLVIGDVQSGKTSNFLGLMALSIDKGFQVIIVLSGTTNLLRNQTQKRFEEAFDVNDPNLVVMTSQDIEKNKVSLEHGPYTEWVSGDFKTNDVDLEQENRNGKTIIFICKKTKNTLENLESELSNYEFTKNNPILIIDDESDSASINTIRPRSEVDNTDEDEAENREETATAINNLIRSIVKISTSTVYLGYTATPYAALLSNPFENDEELGPSLYPRDVILTLPTPVPHCGITEYFSPHGYLRRRVTTIRDNAEIVLSDVEPDHLPESLKNSILDFIISGALKLRNKGTDQFHHTMLIHNHIRTDNHRCVAQLVQRFGSDFCSKYKRSRFSRRENEYHTLKERWESEFLIPPTEEERMDGFVKSFMSKFRWPNMVKTINSSDDDTDHLFKSDSRLDYSIPGRWYIAVGGTILSRGLTVEGLSTSYFTRQSALYDSLTQMARWCGYHSPEDQKLIRVVTTAAILDWFQWIFRVDSQIRDDVAVLEARNGSPVDISPKILRYNDEETTFLPTRRGAMHYAVLRGLSYSGTSPSTLQLPLGDSLRLQNNIHQVHRIVERVESWSNMELAGGKKGDIDFASVYSFIEQFSHSENFSSFDTTALLNYINERRSEGELSNWTLCLYSPSRNRDTNIDWPINSIPKPNVTERGMMPQGRLDVIFDKRHTAEDICHLIEDRRDITRRSAREARPVSHAQLAIYLLSSKYVPGGGSRGFTPLYPGGEDELDVVAFGIVLPDADVDAQQFWLADGLSPVDGDVID